jgi:hypothetical protein
VYYGVTFSWRIKKYLFAREKNLIFTTFKGFWLSQDKGLIKYLWLGRILSRPKNKIFLFSSKKFMLLKAD